jgi:acyl-CoA reductase-like NAD-dependent aldehyde dehydrogenase
LDEIIGFAPLSTREETREAVAAARAAFPVWRDTPAPVRGRVIAKAALVMGEQKDDLARLMTREEGKTLKDALGEVQKSINILEFMAGEGRRMGDRGDCAVEFPRFYPRLENRSSVGCWKHRCL